MKTSWILSVLVLAGCLSCFLCQESAESGEATGGRGRSGSRAQSQLLRGLLRTLRMGGGFRRGSPSERDLQRLAGLVDSLPGTLEDKRAIFREFLAGQFLPVAAATAEAAVVGLGVDPAVALEFIRASEQNFAELVATLTTTGTPFVTPPPIAG